MPKKTGLIIGVILLVLVGAGVFAATKLRSNNNTTQEEQTNKKKKVSEPLNVIPVTERPYLQIIPQADGRNLEIAVLVLNKPAESVEYELEYQTGELIQGAFGEIDLTKVPTQTKVLMGSCSAGGACTYHEDVKGGSLLTRYTGPQNYALKSDWKYIDNKAEETQISSRDAKFQLTSEDIADNRYLVIFNTPGYPEGLQGEPVSDPYSLTSSSDLSGKATLVMRANEASDSLKIMAWNGKEWTEYTGKVEDKMIEAEVDLAELYIVVK